MINRDSTIWVLLIFGSIIGYLATLPNPMTWTYEQMMNALVVLIGILSAKLSASNLAGNLTPPNKVDTILGGLVQVNKPVIK